MVTGDGRGNGTLLYCKRISIIPHLQSFLRMSPAPGRRSLEMQKDVLEQGSSVQDGLQSAGGALFTNFKWKEHGGWMGEE